MKETTRLLCPSNSPKPDKSVDEFLELAHKSRQLLNRKDFMPKLVDHPVTANNKALVEDIKETVDTIASNMEYNIGGFTVVMWTPEGVSAGVMHAEKGAIGKNLIPVFVHDILQKQLILESVNDESDS